MLESSNEIYLCDYNSPSIQMKKSGKKSRKKYYSLQLIIHLLQKNQELINI